ncbi:MAG TPA: nucleoside deaminase [Acidimicrobiales bacterium]|nr:nucleoside deaminase [Acidimicrobiales bacterium]
MAAPPTLPLDDGAAMAIALEEAAAAAAAGEVPVGAVVLDGSGALVARRHNEREAAGDPAAHAELLALRDAARVAGTWRLSGHVVVATLEPCVMCAGGLVAARVARVVFAAPDPQAGACGSVYNVCADPRLNHEVEVTAGVEAARGAALLGDFFAARRQAPGTL